MTQISKALRIYGKDDLRLDTFELPSIHDDEIRMRVVCDSVCMSTYKALKLGSDHRLIRDDTDVNPAIIGHEFSGVLTEVGSKWKDDFRVGQSCTIQVALKDTSKGIAGYSMTYCGGDATYINIPAPYMEQKNLLPFDSSHGFYCASMAEPVSCNIRAFRAMFHSVKGEYRHVMGITEGGVMGMFGACGPMGLGGLGYLLNCDRRPSTLVVADIDEEKLRRAESIFTKDYARARGVEIGYVLLTGDEKGSAEKLLRATGGRRFDDISVYAPVPSLITMADSLLSYDGCLNFFSGPIDKDFSAPINFYDVHYASHHFVGTSGGGRSDMIEALELFSSGALDPAYMISHIGGINCAADTIKALPNIPGGKKLIYTHIDMPLTAISDIEALSKADTRLIPVAEALRSHGGMWNKTAEAALLSAFENPIT